MLDTPIYKDWILYLWLLSIVSIIPGTLLSTNNGGGLGSFFIGFIFQSLIFLILPSVIRNGIREKRGLKNSNQQSTRYENLKNNAEKVAEQIQIKRCSNCGREFNEMWITECGTCKGSSFIHDKKEVEIELPKPEFKKCPMCAEDIKYDAKKCRYCLHILD